MKLVMSIVKSDDADQLLDALTQAGYRATTISTTGGFLRQGNTTIFVGVEDAKVQDVLQLVKQNCCTRSEIVSPLPPVMESGEMYIPTAVDVQMGGATVFVLDIVQFEQF